MKRYLGWLAIFITVFALTGCLYKTSRKPAADLTYETWQRQVDVNPERWASGASVWFTRGDMNRVDEMNYEAPVSAAMTTMTIKVPESFTTIRVNGRFKVQIFGTQECNSVYIYGPNAAARSVKVKVTRESLTLEELDDAPRNMGTVIIRIGIRDLRLLDQRGPGQIEARYIHSGCLTVNSNGSGNIYLGGIYNLIRVTSHCAGNISLFGAVTPRVDILTTGAGTVNVSGKVGLHNVTHHGFGNINIIGANSRDVVIRADGKGKVGINGRIGVREIDARDRVCVFAYYIDSDILNVYVTEHAHVGVAGCARAMNVDTGKLGRFDGRYLFATDVYVRAHDASHANITGTNKVFAAATGNSSVYLFSSPNVLTQFYRDHGVILPILTGEKYPCGYCPYFGAPKIYKD